MQNSSHLSVPPRLCRSPGNGARRDPPPRRDRGDQPPTGRRYGTTHLPLLNRASNDFASTGLPGLPSSVFVCVVIVRAIVPLCLIVRPYVCVFVYARVLVLFNRFLIALPQFMDTAPLLLA